MSERTAAAPRTRLEPRVLLALCACALVASGIGPRDRATWWLEVFPVLIGAPLVVALARRFPLTPLVQRLLFVHALILILGGHYTYAEVPLGYWVRDALGLARNHYDRLGHFAQGFVPAMVAREVLLRCTPLRGGWLFFVTTSIALAISAAYELIEWAAALIFGADADAFLGTQGDPWDTQWDMFLALAGALVASGALSRAHDRQLAALLGASDELRVAEDSSGGSRAAER